MRSKLRVASRYLTTKAEKKSKNAKSPKKFWGASGFFRGRPPQTMHDCISKSIDLYVCPKCCTFAPYFIKV